MFNIILSAILLINPLNKHALTFTHQIKGTVISADTKQPVTNAYVYIIKGEEEALTNAKGEFTITTAEQIPFSLTVIHKDFRESKYKINNSYQAVKIILNRK
jgi:hypothetical protein